jgi:small conductance mechanosensitive channel
MDLQALRVGLTAQAADLSLKLLGALALWVIGSGLARLAVRVVRRGLESSQLDSTLARYAENALGMLLKVVLVVAILGSFGLELKTFAAVLTATGIAVGAAWSGLLSHYAAGVFMMVLRPFKAGDIITAGGVSGYVEEIGLFTTTISTPDRVRTHVGNHKILSNVIRNYTANPHRRVNVTVQLSHGEDHRAAIALLKEKVAAIPNVVRMPVPEVDILTFTPEGPVLAVRPYAHGYHYWQVYFDTTLAIRDAGFAVPETLVRFIQSPP